ncbi:SGNH/GDSL hydrolase family protein [Gordonia sp. (in: high G+C Gram-positive bacteria)]|uniref:SGNH/GDSL hydrolase family protein n=1 Tax=Gordonia sp. (in: high G+C Gram-positive bacteria) TaxID=84139 RepID=UPI0039E26869
MHKARVIVAVMTVGAVVGLSACGGHDQPSVAPPSSTGAVSGGVRYAHLGDSYAAGSGIDRIIEDSPAMCLRSQENFGQLLAARRGYVGADFADVSCGAATTANLTAEQYFGVPPQVDVLGPRTELVTIMIGGNDDRLFADAVADCGSVAAGDPAGDPCRRARGGEFDARIADAVAPDLDDAIALLRQRAPRARIIVLGYPRLLPERGGCYPQVQIAAGDVGYMNAVGERLNTAIAAAAGRHGATYVDMWAASVGHDACAGPDHRWIEPTRGSRIRTTAHPNAAGQRAMADAVDRALG